MKNMKKIGPMDISTKKSENTENIENLSMLSLYFDIKEPLIQVALKEFYNLSRK